MRSGLIRESKGCVFGLIGSVIRLIGQFLKENNLEMTLETLQVIGLFALIDIERDGGIVKYG